MPAIIEIIRLAVRHLDEVPDLARRAELLTAASKACASAGDRTRAEKLRHVALDLQRADDAQLELNELFSTDS